MLQPHDLRGVHLTVAVRVVTDQHLGELGVELLDMLAELVPVFEVELVLPALLDRHREHVAFAPRLSSDVGAELLVDQEADVLPGRAVGHGLLEPLEDDLLGVRDPATLLRVRGTGDPQHLLLEGAPVVERQDVQVLFVSERAPIGAGRIPLCIHGVSLPSVPLRGNCSNVHHPRKRAPAAVGPYVLSNWLVGVRSSTLIGSHSFTNRSPSAGEPITNP